MADKAERKRLEDEAERKRLADEVERKKLADEAERKRLAAKAEKKRLEDEAKMKETEKKGNPSIAVKKEDEDKTQAQQPFTFGRDGIPIWDVRPLPSVPQWPPGLDADKWLAHMTDEYNKSRRNIFNRIYKSAIGKKERREKEEKDRIEKQAKEVRDKAERERKEAEEREKEAARQRREKREKLEKEGQKYAEDLISLDFDFTDEESDDEQADSGNEVKPQDAENGKGKPEDAENRNGKPDDAKNRNREVEKADILIEPTDEDETDLDEEKPLGGEASDANSSVSTYSTPSRTPWSPKRLLNRSGTNKPQPMGANTVQILSNPKIIVALEQFQGIRKEQDEVQLLSNPKILAALKDFHSQMEQGNVPAPENVVVVPNEEEDMFNKSVLQNIKQEEKLSSKPAKRKLTEYDEFSKVWTTPKRIKKKESEKGFAFSAGSPHRGEVAMPDATTDELKKMVDVKIDWIRKGDRVMAGSKSTQSKNIFTQVSYCFLVFLY